MSLPIGRPKGALNIATRQLKEFWHEFFTSEEYRRKAKQRILDGCAPHLESYLLNRIYGKPLEQVEVSVVGPEEDLSMLSVEDLARRLAEVSRQLEEAKALEAALSTEYHVHAQSPANLSDHSTEHAKNPAESQHAHASKDLIRHSVDRVDAPCEIDHDR